MQNKYNIGDIIKCTVTGIEKYGIFVNIDAYYNGLIHISEISEGFVNNINSFVDIDETIYCRVLDIDEDNHQIKLSIKDINYKDDSNDSPIQETRKAFLPLKENLNKWIEETLIKYKE